MILLTGAAGFIGSALAAYLNEQGLTDLVLVDDFSASAKRPNWLQKRYRYLVERHHLWDWLRVYARDLTAIFHLGARTDTFLQDEKIFHELNLTYSQKLWTLAAEYGIPFFYASSAATYGDGSQGFSDDERILPLLKPLNPYARSKHAFDLWAVSQPHKPPRWAGFKFFNVYGPNEYHKGPMSSVAYRGFLQILQENELRLFRSYKPEYADGEQKRDFIYVRDVVEVLYFFLTNPIPSGIYNLGTGRAETFLALGEALFRALGKSPRIRFIDMPEAIRENYQYFTEADIRKLRQAGYTKPFHSVSEGVEAYVRGYLYPTLRYW
jgi:ADP-L-glycero-D-manno-heptose 6-epimerase